MFIEAQNKYSQRCYVNVKKIVAIEIEPTTPYIVTIKTEVGDYVYDSSDSHNGAREKLEELKRLVG